MSEQTDLALVAQEVKHTRELLTAKMDAAADKREAERAADKIIIDTIKADGEHTYAGLKQLDLSTAKMLERKVDKEEFVKLQEEVSLRALASEFNELRHEYDNHVLTEAKALGERREEWLWKLDALKAEGQRKLDELEADTEAKLATKVPAADPKLSMLWKGIQIVGTGILGALMALAGAAMMPPKTAQAVLHTPPAQVQYIPAPEK